MFRPLWKSCEFIFGGFVKIVLVSWAIINTGLTFMNYGGRYLPSGLKKTNRQIMHKTRVGARVVEDKCSTASSIF